MNRAWIDVAVPGFCGMGMNLRLDGFRLVYCAVAVFMWAVSGIFSREYMSHYANRRRYYVFFWATFAATVGVFLSADLFTTFIFFEIMSFTSYVWVAFDERAASLRAAETYLAVAVIGGMVMLMGLFLLYDLFGTLQIEEISLLAEKVTDPETRKRLYLAGALLLFGFGAKAGVFPLHIWLPKAHPQAPAPASALLSGILTKAGVFGIIVVSCGLFGADHGWGLLVAGLGLVTMFLGALLALFSVDLKRTLACSSISQIGFIVTGIGMACLLRSAGEGNALAVRGAFLHMVNHSLFKLVLFLCAGVVYMNLHELDLNAVRGFGRGKPLLAFAFLMGALGIGGVPLWSGYISKTLLHESIVEYVEITGGLWVWRLAEWVFLLAGGMTVAYMLKLFVAVFVEKNADKERQRQFDGLCRAAGHAYMRPLTGAALTAAAVLPPLLGMTAHLSMDRIADLGQGFFHMTGDVRRVDYLSFGNLKGSLISIVIGAVLYVFVVRGLLMEPDKTGGRRYVDRWPSWLDLEELVYRPLLQTALPAVGGAVCGFIDRYLVSSVVTVFVAVSTFCSRVLDSAVDWLILLARKTTHRQLHPARQQHDADLAAHTIGGAIDMVSAFRGRLPWRRDRAAAAGTADARQEESASVRLARKEEQFKSNIRLVQESFSYGLMLVCIGLCLTLGYLLLGLIGK